MTRTMFDAAWLPTPAPAVDVWAGYVGGENAAHVWSSADWDRAAKAARYLLPIYVYGTRYGDPAGRAATAFATARKLGMPLHVGLAIDVEQNAAAAYHASGFARVWTDTLLSLGAVPVAYTSASTAHYIDSRQPLWLAEYRTPRVPFMFDGAVATQWTNELPGRPFDQSLVRDALALWPTRAPDPPPPAIGRDDTVWILACEGQATYLVFGDRAVRVLDDVPTVSNAESNGVKVLRPSLRDYSAIVAALTVA